jgi:hypothetical protein
MDTTMNEELPLLLKHIILHASLEEAKQSGLIHSYDIDVVDSQHVDIFIKPVIPMNHIKVNFIVE